MVIVPRGSWRTRKKVVFEEEDIYYILNNSQNQETISKRIIIHYPLHQTKVLMAASINFVNPPPTFLKPNFRTRKTVLVHCSCSQPQQNNDDQQQHQQSPTPLRKKNEKNKLGKLAMIAVAAGVLTFGSISVNVDDALAAKTGGRIGGQSFRSSAPRPSAPRINNNNSRTNIYINPRVAPPLGGGYGYGGVPYYGGGWGWSPFSFFAPGPSVAVGIGGGFDTILLFMFFGAAAAVVRRFFGSRNVEDDDDY